MVVIHSRAKKIEVKGQLVETIERKQTDGHDRFYYLLSQRGLVTTVHVGSKDCVRQRETDNLYFTKNSNKNTEK